MGTNKADDDELLHPYIPSTPTSNLFLEVNFCKNAQMFRFFFLFLLLWFSYGRNQTVGASFIRVGTKI